MNKHQIFSLLVVVAALSFLVVYISRFVDQPYYHSGVSISLFDDGFHLLAVAADSTADQAGLRPGLVISKINGIDAVELNAISESDLRTFLQTTSSLFKIGEVVDFETSAGEHYRFTIEESLLEKRLPIMSWSVLSDAAVGAAFMLIGVGLSFIGRNKRLMLNLLGFTIGAGLALTTSYFFSYWSFPFIWLRFVALDISGVIAGVSLISFSQRFPDYYPPSYPVALLGSILALAVKYLAIIFGFINPFGYVVYFIHLYLIVALVFSIVILVIQYRSASALGRIRLRWVFVGATASLVPYLLYLTSLIFRSGIVANNRSILNTIASISLLIFPVSIGVGIFSYKLFDIDRFIRRLSTLTIMGLFTTLIYILVTTLSPGAQLNLDHYLVLLVTVLMSPAVYELLKQQMIRMLKKTYKAESQILLEMEQSLNEIYRCGDIYNVVSAALIQAFNPTSIAFTREYDRISDVLYRYPSGMTAIPRPAASFSLKQTADAELRLLIGKRRNEQAYSKQDLQLLTGASAQIAKALDTCELYARLQDSLASESSAQRATILSLAKLAEYRDEVTGRHLERIMEYSRLLLLRLRELWVDDKHISDEYIDDVCLSSVLHDVGKVAIPDQILLKPGKLTTEEFDVMKRHTTIGGKVLEEAEQLNPQRSFLTLSKTIAYYHHERWDGTGYPFGMKAEAIPLSARIVAIADVYDALRSKRPYKQAISHEEAMEEIIRNRGSQFDPELVDAFVSIASQVRLVKR